MWACRPPSVWIVVFFAAYLAGAGVAQALATAPESGISIWPPSGLFLATLLLTRRRSWAWWVAVALLAELSANAVWFGNALGVAVLLYLGNALEAIAGAWLLRLIAGGRFRLRSVRDVLVLLLAGAMAAPCVSSTVGAATLWASEGQGFWRSWALWWVGDATGVLVIAPLVLVCVDRARRGGLGVPPGRTLEAAALGLTFVGLVMLSLGGLLPFAYIIMPALLWAALRFEFGGAVVSILVLTLLTAGLTVGGMSPFLGGQEGQSQRHVMMQLLLAISAISALVMAAIARQYRRSREELERSNERLEERVRERTATLRESERRFQNLADTAPAMLWVTDSEHRYIFLSKGWYDYTGQSDEDTPGCRWTEAVHPDDRARAVESFLAAADDGRSFRLEYRLRTKDGSYRWVHDEGRPRVEENGRQVGFVGSVIDIHERRLAEERAHAAAERLTLIADAMPALISYVDREHRYQFNNKAYTSWFGVHTGLFHGRHMREVLGDEAYRSIRTHVEAALSGRRVTFEAEVPYRGCGLRQIRAEYVPDIAADGTVRGFHALVLDQSHQHQLSRTRARLAAIVETSSDAIVSKNLDGIIESWNAGAEQTFGYTAEEAIGQSILMLIPEDLRHEEPLILGRIRRGERIEHFETTRRRKDGRLIDVALTVSPVLDEDGRVIGVSKIARDVSEHKRAEKRVRETEARFRLAADAAGALVYDTQLDDNERAVVHGLERLLGYRPEEVPLTRVWWHSLIHPDDLPGHLAQIDAIIESGGMYVAAYRVRHRDGRFIWIEETTQVIREADAPPRLVGALVEITERMRAEQQLRAAHDSFRLIVERSPFGVFAVNADFQIELVSAGSQRVFASVRPLIGRDLAEALRCVWPEPFASEAIGHFRHTLETGEVYHSPSTVERRNDTAELEAYDWKVERTMLPDGRLGVVCHFYDLSDRMRLEAALRESEARLRRVIDNMLGYVSVLTPDGALIEVNESALAVGGLAREDVIGLKIWDTYWWSHDEEAADRVRDAVRRAAAGEVIRYDETVRSVDDGRMCVDFSLVPVRDESGEIAFLIPSGVDITDRKRVEEALRASEERARMLADNMSQFAWTADATGWIYWFNKRWYEFTGTNFEDMKGWGWRQVNHPDYVDRVTKKFREHVEAGIPWEDTFPIRGADGEYRWFLSRALPIRDEDGEVKQWFGTNTDITAQREVEQALAQHKALLEERVRERTEQLRESHTRLRISERMASLGTLSAGLGHDMGNLLVPVRVCIDALEAADLPPEQQSHVSEIKVSAEYLQQLANGLRLMSIDPDRSTASYSTPLDEWWADARQVMRTALPRGIELDAEFEAGCVVDMAKPALTQVVFNLVQNAGDAMRGGVGTRLSVGARGEGESVVLTVTDDGPGMPPEVRDRCLEPFFTTKTRDISTGLGLVLVSGLVKDAGGTVELESEEGRGTRFTIRLRSGRCESDERGEPLVRGRAVVRLDDARMSAFVMSELKAARFEVAEGEEQADIAVVDESPDVDDWLDRVRHLIVFGEHATNGRVVAVGAKPRPASIREAVRSVARVMDSEEAGR